jgi:hypothetical protein
MSPHTRVQFADKLCRALVATAILLTSVPAPFFSRVAHAQNDSVTKFSQIQTELQGLRGAPGLEWPEAHSMEARFVDVWSSLRSVRL